MDFFSDGVDFLTPMPLFKSKKLEKMNEKRVKKEQNTVDIIFFV